MFSISWFLTYYSFEAGKVLLRQISIHINSDIFTTPRSACLAPWGSFNPLPTNGFQSSAPLHSKDKQTFPQYPVGHIGWTGTCVPVGRTDMGWLAGNPGERESELEIPGTVHAAMLILSQQISSSGTLFPREFSKRKRRERATKRERHIISLTLKALTF